MTDVSVLLLCVTVLVLWWRVEPRIDRVIALHTISPQVNEGTSEVPIDIEQQALSWQDGHAQESYRARAREIYAESAGPTEQRWDRVRSILTLEAEA